MGSQTAGSPNTHRLHRLQVVVYHSLGSASGATRAGGERLKGASDPRTTISGVRPFWSRHSNPAPVAARRCTSAAQPVLALAYSA